MTTDPEPTLHHAVDVTVEDAWAILEFLAPRLESLERAHDGDTEEHRTAAALAEAMSALVLALESEIRGPNRGRLRNRSAPPPTPVPSPTEDERIAKKKRRLTMIAEYWNQLCGIVHPWRESDGYDRARWHPVTFLDTAAEAEYHRRVAEAGLRKAE
ncbi:hypothetical protein ACFV7R_46815 [Streptomyces sp. NPDC059866]|uniref:hypothetical protein n=1 Tax=Streptomyces sp. NPDC059866 TaxID=3346978 RepID=UPI00364AC506